MKEDIVQCMHCEARPNYPVGSIHGAPTCLFCNNIAFYCHSYCGIGLGKSSGMKSLDSSVLFTDFFLLHNVVHSFLVLSV